jgi:glutamate carboxypeptidase
MTPPVSWFADRTVEMVEQTAALVEVESPSDDPAALRACAHAITGLSHAILARAPELVEVGGFPHLRWTGGGSTRVLLLGHLDTVWPLGTLATMPCVQRDGRLHGPGTFDMKAGIVLALHALSALDDLDGVGMLLTSDEESGSATSRALIEATAGGLAGVLVLEPSGPGGALKTARKGVASYRVVLEGRAAHAGLEPEKGVNAVVEAAHEVLDAAALAAEDLGTTVTPTIVRGGTMVNVVPGEAVVEIDVRAETVDELSRVGEALARRQCVVATGRSLTTVSWRPPMEPQASSALLATARRVAGELGIARPAGIAVGGGSDGNFTAALGTPTLDGLGAVGDGAHAAHEHVDVAQLAPRAALLAGLLDAIRHGPG